jgi:hypothetical protein
LNARGPEGISIPNPNRRERRPKMASIRGNWIRWVIAGESVIRASKGRDR